MNKSDLRSFALSGVLVTGIALCAAAVFAQDAPPPDNSAQPSAQGPGPGPRRGPMDPGTQLARMTKRYQLTPDQQSRIKPILESRQRQMMSLRQDGSLSRDDMRAKMQSIRSDSTAKIEAVLNDQQKQQFDQDQQRMARRGPGGAPGGGAPPQ